MEQTKLIIDRFEEDFAVCEQEDGSMIEIDKNLLPSDANEGDCITKIDETTFEIDYERTKQLQDEIKDLFNDLYDK